jgi:lysyl-tRNA synthetase, class I
MSKEKNSNAPVHWADQTAKNIIREKGDKDKYTIAAGITPSGTIHIGNFREVITIDLINRALKSINKEVRFIYSWDDYDVFRKVPKNMPQQDMLKTYLRKPITSIPDPFGKEENYARHNELEFEKELPKMGISPEFIQQSKQYKESKYAEEMKTALEKTDKIKEILNNHRKEPLEDEWLPVTLFCEKCGCDDNPKIEYKGDYNLAYECKCGHKDEFDFREKGIAKLKWRVDWPARWHHEKVDFESGGKDHFAAGGSFDTCKEIVKEVYNHDAPTSMRYEWIAIKGKGQFASSSGVVITLKEIMEIYEPSLVRWFFASTRPTAEFEISFDLDVLKYYEDFDMCERIYYKKEKGMDEKEQAKQSRIYELSSVKLNKEMPFQPSIRHLTTIYQLYQGNLENIKEFYKDELKTKEDEERLLLRAECVKNWLKQYAPEAMKFEVQKNVSDETKAELADNQKKSLKILKERLEKNDYTEDSLYNDFMNICKEADVKPGEFFQAAYKTILNKDRGPKLAGFIILIGIDKVIELLGQI